MSTDHFLTSASAITQRMRNAACNNLAIVG